MRRWYRGLALLVCGVGIFVWIGLSVNWSAAGAIFAWSWLHNVEKHS